MTVFAAYGPEMDNIRLWASYDAAVAGVRRHGITVVEGRVGETPFRRSDCLIINGWRKPGRAHTELIDAQLAAGGRVLVIDRGYVRRKSYWSLGWDGLNGRADFRNKGMNPNRWARIGVELTPYRMTGRSVVVMGQVATDAAVIHVDLPDWVRKTIRRLRSLTDRPIVFRPHPKSPQDVVMEGAEVHTGHINDALADAWAVVTFNSNSAVDALIAGVPVFVADEGSMAWEIGCRDLAAIDAPPFPDRSQWAADLAYAQWTHGEMATGLAWDHLRSGF